LAGKALGDERSGYAAADDQGIAFDVLADLKSNGMVRRRIPGRTPPEGRPVRIL